MGLRDEVRGATELVGNGNKQRVKGPREEMGECLSDKIMPAIRETLLMEQWKDITKSFCFPSVDETPFVRTSPFHFCCFCSGKKTPDIVLPYDLSLSIYMYIYISFCWYEIYIYMASAHSHALASKYPGSNVDTWLMNIIVSGGWRIQIKSPPLLS